MYEKFGNVEKTTYLCINKKDKDMKTGSFRKVRFTIRPTSSYGHYEIEAVYRGKKVRTYTNCSETYDYVDDDSNKEKYVDARKSCYILLTMAYYENY